jgi:hypothetical protein
MGQMPWSACTDPNCHRTEEMKALVLEEYNKLVYRDWPDPEPAVGCAWYGWQFRKAETADCHGT